MIEFLRYPLIFPSCTALETSASQGLWVSGYIYIMWCWRRMEKIIWTDHVRNEEVLLTVKKQMDILCGERTLEEALDVS